MPRITPQRLPTANQRRLTMRRRALIPVFHQLTSYAFATDNEGMGKQVLLSPLTIASFLYRSAIALRHHAYRTGFFTTQRLSVPVISVGNLTTGGTGKTPFTIYLARALTATHHRVAVLSRGYRGSARQPINVVSDGSRILLSPEAAGDEPYLMAEKLPGVAVLTGRDRARAGEYAQRHFSANVVLLDDGFQHLALHRDLNLLLLNGRYPLGNGHLVPRGSLREPTESLSRADVIVFMNRGEELTPSRAETLVRRYNRSAPLFHASYVPTSLKDLYSGEDFPLASLQGKKAVAFAGIACPQPFQSMLTALGARLIASAFFPDHHHYRPCDLSVREQEALIVTTEKDAVKLRQLPFRGCRVMVLGIEVHVKKEKEFYALLKNYLPSQG